MAKGISDIGNGNGFIYVVDPDGSTVLRNIINNESGVKEAKSLGVQAAALALNRSPVGIIEVTGTWNATVTSIKVGSTEQISSFTINSSDEDTVAKEIADQVNSYIDNPNGSSDYTAQAIGHKVYFIGDPDIGSGDNGKLFNITSSGTINLTTTDVDDGSDSSEVYDQSFGYRFYLDADYGAGECSGDGTAVEGDISSAEEITEYIVNRGLQSAVSTDSVSVSSGEITPSRKGVITALEVDTEGNASSDLLNGINPKGFANNDLIVLYGKNTNRIVTVNTNSVGNLVLDSDSNFKTGNKAKHIVFRYHQGKFYEVARSTQQIGSRSDYRTAGFPFSVHGKDTFDIPTNGNVSLRADQDEKYQIVSNTQVLSGDVDVKFKRTGAVKGDSFIIEYDGNVTENGNNLQFTDGGAGGDSVSLSAQEALNGGIVIYAYYTGSVWEIRMHYDFSKGAKVEKDNIQKSVVSADKAEAPLKTDHFEQLVSFESGEQGNTLRPIFTKGTITRIEARVKKSIAMTDDGTITFKDDDGNIMGTMNFPKNTSVGTGKILTSGDLSNNTFAGGDYVNAATSKSTAGGEVEIYYKFVKSEA